MSEKKWKWSSDILDVQGTDYKGPQTEQQVRGLAAFCMLKRDQTCLKELRSFVHDEWKEDTQRNYLLDFLDCNIDYTDFLLEKIKNLQKEKRRLNLLLLLSIALGVLMFTML